MTSEPPPPPQPAQPGGFADAPIVVDAASKWFGSVVALSEVSCTIGWGVTALLGPNGAGKSTLLKVMSGRMRPSAGEVVIGDTPIGKTSAEKLVRQGVCAVPEGRGIFPNLNVRENLRIWTYRGGITVKDVEERTFETFPVLKERRRQLAGTMSGGEQQMLAISRALVTNPRVLYLDELSMGLAPLIVSELYDLVGKLSRQGMTIVLVEQFVTTALAVADHAAIMVHGRIEQQGTPADMAEAALSVYLA